MGFNPGFKGLNLQTTEINSFHSTNQIIHILGHFQRFLPNYAKYGEMSMSVHGSALLSLVCFVSALNLSNHGHQILSQHELNYTYPWPFSAFLAQLRKVW